MFGTIFPVARMFYSESQLVCSFIIIQGGGNLVEIKTLIGNVRVKLNKNKENYTCVEIVVGDIGEYPVVIVLVSTHGDAYKWQKWLNDNTPKPARVLPPEPQQLKPDPKVELPR